MNDRIAKIEDMARKFGIKEVKSPEIQRLLKTARQNTRKPRRTPRTSSTTRKSVEEIQAEMDEMSQELHVKEHRKAMKYQKAKEAEELRNGFVMSPMIKWDSKMSYFGPSEKELEECGYELFENHQYSELHNRWPISMVEQETEEQVSEHTGLDRGIASAVVAISALPDAKTFTSCSGTHRAPLEPHPVVGFWVRKERALREIEKAAAASRVHVYQCPDVKSHLTVECEAWQLPRMREFAIQLVSQTKALGWHKQNVKRQKQWERAMAALDSLPDPTTKRGPATRRLLFMESKCLFGNKPLMTQEEIQEDEITRRLFLVEAKCLFTEKDTEGKQAALLETLTCLRHISDNFMLDFNKALCDSVFEYLDDCKGTDCEPEPQHTARRLDHVLRMLRTQLERRMMERRNKKPPRKRKAL